MIQKLPILHLMLAFSCMCQTLLSVATVDEKTDVSKKNRCRLLDINATLFINIEIDSLRQMAMRISGSGNEIQKRDIEQVTKLLKMQNEILKQFCDTTGNFEQRKKRLSSISGFYNDLLSYADKIPDLRQEVNTILESSENGGEYRSIGLMIEKYVDSISSVLNDLEKNERIYIRLAGFIQDKHGNQRNIHIQGFDSYAEGEHYDVPYFIKPNSEEFKKMLDTTAKSVYENATSLFKVGNTVLDGFENYKNQLSSALIGMTNVANSLQPQLTDTGYIERLEIFCNRLLYVKRQIEGITAGGENGTAFEKSMHRLVVATNSLNMIKDTLPLIFTDVQWLVDIDHQLIGNLLSLTYEFKIVLTLADTTILLKFLGKLATTFWNRQYRIA